MIFFVKKRKKYLFIFIPREAAKKVLFLVAGTLRGGGVNGCATKEKKIFFNESKKVHMATKPRGRGP